MKVIPQKDPITGEEEKIIPYSEYVDDLEVGVVFNRVDAFMNDLDEDDKFTRIRVACSLFSGILCLLGIYLILLGGAVTEAFQSQPRLLWLQIIGGLFQIPIVFWFIFMCCPSREERQRRRVIKQKRKMRKEIYADKNDSKFITMVNGNIKERVTTEKQQQEMDKEKEIAEKKANPLGYPKKK